MKRYELTPTNGRKSFYGKAIVVVDEAGDETLYSYDTKIITRTKNGDFIRWYDGYTPTTGTHIKSFCGLDKANFTKLEVSKEV